MNLDEAIRSHLQWKVRLRTSISARRVEEASAHVRADDRCDLGKWLYGDGLVQYGDSAAFQTLRANHARFHRAAAAVVEKMEAGDFDLAGVMIEEGTEYSEATSNVRNAISALQRSLAAAS